MDFQKELTLAKETVLISGEKIMRIYNSNEVIGFELKPGEEPVTLADKTSNKIICLKILENFPDDGILTEEEFTPEEIDNDRVYDTLLEKTKNWREYERVWFIDPLDGTKEFLRKSGEFGPQIGLMVNNTIVLGVHYYPFLRDLYYATKDFGAWKQEGTDSPFRLYVSSKRTISDLNLIISRTSSSTSEKVKDLISRNKFASVIEKGSFGLKACYIAEGRGDIYFVSPRKISLWDSCSSQIILEEAGGRISYFNGDSINYRPNGNTKLANKLVLHNNSDLEEIIDLFK